MNLNACMILFISLSLVSEAHMRREDNSKDMQGAFTLGNGQIRLATSIAPAAERKPESNESNLTAVPIVNNSFQASSNGTSVQPAMQRSSPPVPIRSNGTSQQAIIPDILHIVMTKPAFPEAKVEFLSPQVKANLDRNILLNPGFQVKLHGEDDCLKCVKESKSPELAEVLDKSKKNNPGNQPRVNICRACVLFSEGGWYIDLDVEMVLPFKSLSEGVSFVGGWSDSKSGQSSLIGVSQQSSLMTAWLTEMDNQRGVVLNAMAARSKEKTSGERTTVDNNSTTGNPSRIVAKNSQSEGQVVESGNLSTSTIESSNSSTSTNKLPTSTITSPSLDVEPLGWGADMLGKAYRSAAAQCGGTPLKYPDSEGEICGERVRLFIELDWDSVAARSLVDSAALQAARQGRESSPRIAHYGFFSPRGGTLGSKLVAYQRFKGCSSWGCNANGSYIYR